MLSLITTDVLCTQCQEPLCNICGFNGSCEHCGKKISYTQDKSIIQFLKNQEKN